MNKIFSFFAVTSLISISAFADLEVDLQRCSLQCSSACMDSITKAKELIYEADANCDANNSITVDCINYLASKGFNPETNKQNCKNMDAESLRCLKALVDKGYTPAASNSGCLNASEGQANCIIDLVNQGYAPDIARNSCMQN